MTRPRPPRGNAGLDKKDEEDKDKKNEGQEGQDDVQDGNLDGEVHPDDNSSGVPDSNDSVLP